MHESILTYKINLKRQIGRKSKKTWYKVRRKINKYLRVAKRVAQYSIDHKKGRITSHTVKHLGKLPSCISNQIVRKYKNNPKCKKITNVNLIVPACSTTKYPSITHSKEVLTIKPLKLSLVWHCPMEYTKINQIEINNEFCYITISTDNLLPRPFKSMIGVDVNVKHNLAAVGNPETKEVHYLGKGHIYKRAKYLAIRARWQRQGRTNRVKLMGKKEHRVMSDINHKVSSKILELAIQQKSDVSIEDLTGIRQAPNRSKGFKALLNSWGFYQLRQYIEYKCELNGVEVFAIDPRYTSQDCSGCGSRTKCSGKAYQCKACGLQIHRDENASYNIADRGITEYNSIYTVPIKRSSDSQLLH